MYSLGKYPVVQLLGCRIVPSLTFKKMFIYLTERERENTSGGGAERERERIPSRLYAASPEPISGLKLTNCEIMT